MLLDTFGAVLLSLIDPARNCLSITPNDNAVVPFLPRAIYVGTGGAFVVRAIDGSSDVTFIIVANGTILAIPGASVRATGSTATNLIGRA